MLSCHPQFISSENNETKINELLELKRKKTPKQNATRMSSNREPNDNRQSRMLNGKNCLFAMMITVV